MAATASPSHKTEKMTGAAAIVRSLEELGIDLVFGLPGGAILPLYDPLYQSTKIRHVLVRHEQAAGHAAEGYALATGKVGVCIATSGPGATNLVTPIADAMLDSVPLIAITGQVGRSVIGTDAFQEADIRGVTLPVTKHNVLITDVNDIPRALAEAYHVATTGRPGPVLVDFPKDMQNAECDFSWPPTYDLPGYKPVTKPHNRQIKAAVQAIAEAKRPVILAGGGIIKANASKELREFAHATGIPVTTTLMALGTMPYDDDLYLGMPGMHGCVSAVAALQRSDLVIAIGARFDDRVTGRVDSFAPDAITIHADVDPAEIGKIRSVDIPIVGDAKRVLEGFLKGWEKLVSREPTPDFSAWNSYLAGLKERYPLSYEEPSDGLMSPQYVLETLTDIVGPDVIYTSGVGQHQMWAAQFLKLKNPRSFINSGGLGTMGFAVPTALGAQAGCPSKEVWAIDGDGSFQMTNQEITTCTLEGFPIKVLLLNNGNLGMVRQWQTLFYEKRYSNTNLHPKGEYIPDFVKLSEAMGAEAIRVTRPEEVEPAIERAREINDRPVVIECIVSEDAQVWPMIAAGESNSEIQYALGVRPDFTDSEEV